MMEDQQRYRDALAQYLVSEKDQRPYWETDHRGMVMPLVKSGYNNSVSYGVPGIAGGSAWGVLNDIISGRQVAKGEIEQGASDAAGAAMTGGFALGSRPQNSVGMFAGRHAKTADHAALAKAEELAASGAPREQIWKDTGWFRGADGKWRFEIDDSGSSITNWAWASPENSEAKSYGAIKPAPHRELLNHNQLYDAYPNIGESKGIVTPVGPRDGFTDGRGITVAGMDNIQDARSVALHEMQHVVQENEGWFPGYKSPAEFSAGDPGRAAYTEYWLKRKADVEAMKPNALQRLFGMTGEYESALAKYQTDLAAASEQRGKQLHFNAPSEREARAVQARMNMTPEDRGSRPPWLDFELSANAPTSAASPLINYLLQYYDERNR